MGATGSLHCVGMCGPLAMLVRAPGSGKLLLNRFLYHTGKASTYMMLGAIMGVFGDLFQFQNFQNIFSILAGVGVIIFLLLPRTYSIQLPFWQRWIATLRSLIGKQLKSSKSTSAFLFGVLNGLLPCGLVYMALVLAAIQPSLVDSILFMGIFAAGTFPALLAASYSFSWLKSAIPFSFDKVKTTFLILVATLLISRGVFKGMSHPMAGHSTVTVCP